MAAITTPAPRSERTLPFVVPTTPAHVEPGRRTRPGSTPRRSEAPHPRHHRRDTRHLRSVPRPIDTRPAPGPATRLGSPARLLATLALLCAVVGAIAGLAVLPATGEVTVEPATHLVTEGETMWSIASAAAPAGETAAYVERLVAANGGSVVVPGQVLVLPTP